VLRTTGALLLGCLVIASLAARGAVKQAVLAEANVQLALAKAAELFADAARLRHLTLHADVFLTSRGAGAHVANLMLDRIERNVSTVLGR
jgi:hypothetical protein